MGDGIDPQQWQRSAEGTLLEAASQVGLLRSVLERPRWAQEIRDVLQAAHSVAELEEIVLADPAHPLMLVHITPRLCGLACELGDSALAPPVQPGLRKAILAASEGLEALNSVLLRRLKSELAEPSAGRAHSQPGLDTFAFKELADIVNRVSPLTRYLLLALPGLDSKETDALVAADAGLVSRMTAAAGTLLVGGMAGVYATPQCREYLTAQHLMLFSHAFSGLLRVLKLATEDGRCPALAALRSTAFRPQAVLGVLKTLMWRELAGQTSLEGEKGTPMALQELILEKGYYSEETAAIEADPRLQEAIAANLEGDLVPYAAQAKKPQAAFCAAASALCALSSPMAIEGVRRYSARRPEFFQLVLDTIEGFATPGLPVETSGLPVETAVAQAVRFDAIAYGFLFLTEACRWAKEGQHAAQGIGPRDIWRRGAHAMLELLLSDCGPHSGHGASKPMRMSPLLREMMKMATSDMRPVALTYPPTAAQLEQVVAKMQQALPMYETVMRLTAAHLAAAAAPGCSAARRLELEASVADAQRQQNALLPAVIDEVNSLLAGGYTKWLGRDGLPAATCGLLATVVKGLLALAEGVGSGRVPHTTAGWNGVGNATSLAALLFLGASAQLQSAAVPPPDATIRLFNGTALAVWATIKHLKPGGALAGRTEEQRIASVYALFMLLNAMLWWPEARATLLASEASRDTLRGAFMAFLGPVGPQEFAQRPNKQWWMTHAILANVPLCPAAAVALGRAGVLAQLARWAEKACVGLPHAELQRVLDLVQRIAAAAADDWNCGELRGAMRNLPQLLGGTPSLKDPTYWQRLRATVAEPLAADVASDGEDAVQLAAAVAAAEALATRPCAHAGCTTVAGVCEASMPRGKRCSGCRLVRYCGTACQKADWKAHRAACRELQRRKAASSSA